ncbi:hypothetical protein PV727_42665, partial [Streptomyces scabiei]|nr:hypothetical protein [Streptomyces scabiei]
MDGASVRTFAALAAKVRTLPPSMTRSMQRVAEAVANAPAASADLPVTALPDLTAPTKAQVVPPAPLPGYPG